MLPLKMRHWPSCHTYYCNNGKVYSPYIAGQLAGALIPLQIYEPLQGLMDRNRY